MVRRLALLALLLAVALFIPGLARPIPVQADQEPTAVAYTGPTIGYYAGAVSLSGTLQSTYTGYYLANETLSFTIGSQSCSGTTDSNGNASCSITLTQTPGSYQVTAAFAGTSAVGNNYAASSDSASFALDPNTDISFCCIEGTIDPTSGYYGQSVTLEALLVNLDYYLVVGDEPITFTIGSQSCSGTTGSTDDVNGKASCSLTLSQAPGNYSLTAAFAGDPSRSLLESSGSIPFTLYSNLAVAYNGATSGDYNDTVTLSATLTDATDSTPLSGKTVSFTLGSQSCNGTTNSSGAASCSLTPNQAPGSYQVTAAFAGDGTYPAGNDSKPFTINKEDAAVAYNGATSGDYNDSVILSATLTDATDSTPLSGKTVSFTLGSQSCNGTTNSSGAASCSLTPNQAAGSITMSVSFAGDTDHAASSATPTFTVNKEESSLAYNAATSGEYGAPATVSATLTDPADSTPVAGKSVSFTLGSASGAPACSGTTNSTGTASCSLTLTLAAGNHTLQTSFAGDTDYQPSSASPTVTILPNSLLLYNGPSVAAAGATVSLGATLTDASSATPLAGETVGFTLGSQSCSATTDGTGTASCSLTLSQAAGSYLVTAAFAGDSTYPATSVSATFNITTPSRLSWMQVSAHSPLPYAFACGLKSDASLACWGNNMWGQSTPPSGANFVQVSAGNTFACALASDGSLACWGRNPFGESTPPSGAGFVQVSAGTDFACALKSDGSLACWGTNLYGQSTPPAGNTFVQVSAGSAFACALKSSGSLACWGYNSDGRAAPPTGPFTQVSAGGTFACALKTDGSLACWGNPPSGMPSGTNFAQVSAGGNFACALKTDGSLTCWGNNTDGQGTPPALTQPTSLAYTGPTIGGPGASLTVSATLTNLATSQGVPSESVSFTLGSGAGAPTCSGTTDSAGKASCSLTVSQTPGNYTFNIAFAGDSTYNASSTSASFTILKLGDVNGDGSVTAVDALCVLRIVAGLPGASACPIPPLGNPVVALGETNGPTALDALCILRGVAGLPGTATCPAITTLAASPQATAAASLSSTRAGTSTAEVSLMPAAGENGDGRAHTVEVKAQAAAGKLGAWTVDVSYDPTTTKVTGCEAADGSICNTSFASGVVRIAGASATGLSGEQTLATLTVEGTGALKATAQTATDLEGQPLRATVTGSSGGGGPQPSQRP